MEGGNTIEFAEIEDYLDEKFVNFFGPLYITERFTDLGKLNFPMVVQF